MLKLRSTSGKILVPRNHKKLSVEFNLSIHMFVLLNWLLLLYDHLNPGKITVSIISLVVVPVKFLAP